jgi:hypothetical protein
MKALAWDGKSPRRSAFFVLPRMAAATGCLPLFLVLSFVNEKHT